MAHQQSATAKGCQAHQSQGIEGIAQLPEGRHRIGIIRGIGVAGKSAGFFDRSIPKSGAHENPVDAVVLEIE
jgi:hypothetical protein